MLEDVYSNLIKNKIFYTM